MKSIAAEFLGQNKRVRVWIPCSCVALLAGIPALGMEPFEEIWEAPVVDSARPEDRLFETPVGAFTLDHEALNFLPANSIPELLRFAPGVHIQRATNGVWGMGIRGMNSRFFGRTIFTVDEQNPYGDLFGGIFGNVHVMMLEDVASVEVVRGPGGGLWGTNASNGMVNVIPKTAFETEGGHLLLRGGSEEQWGEVRYGWRIDDRSAARVYALANHRDASFSNLGIDDSWDTFRVGVRYDRRPDDTSLLSLSAESYSSDLSSMTGVPDLATGLLSLSDTPERQTGFNAQAKWLKNFSNGGGVVVRAWAGQIDFSASYAIFDLVTYGVEARLEYPWMEGHQLSLTAGLNGEQKDLTDSEVIRFDQSGKDNTQTKLGLRDHWNLSDRWSLSGSVTASHDAALEEWFVQPDLRLIYTPRKESVWWLSASRALRPIPSGLRLIKEIPYLYTPIPPVTIPTPFGPQVVSHSISVGKIADGIKAEELTAYELGHRCELFETVALGLSLFYNEYDNIAYGYVDAELLPRLFIPQPYIARPFHYDNIAKGYSYGFEIDLSWEAHETLRFKLAYSFLKNDFDALFHPTDPLRAEGVASALAEIQHNAPEHTGSLWVTWKPTSTWRFDGTLRYDDGFEGPLRIVPASAQFDLRITWEPDERWRLSVVGRNLLDDHTSQGALKDFVGIATEVEREAYLEVRYAF